MRLTTKQREQALTSLVSDYTRNHIDTVGSMNVIIKAIQHYKQYNVLEVMKIFFYEPTKDDIKVGLSLMLQDEVMTFHDMGHIEQHQMHNLENVFNMIAYEVEKIYKK